MLQCTTAGARIAQIHSRPEPAGASSRRTGSRRPCGSRAGFTLVEAMFSVTILFLATVFVLGFVMNMIWRNRQMSMQVAGLQAINDMMGEIEDLGDTADASQTAAFVIVDHYQNMATAGETINIGPGRTALARVANDAANGRLLYRFWVPEPGESRYLPTDARFTPNHKAVGEMSIYLNETTLRTTILPRFSWTDQGGGPVPPGGGGLDINLNNSFDDNLLNNYADVEQLAITIDVNYYNDELHRSQIFSTSRNILIIPPVKDPSRDVDPTIP